MKRRASITSLCLGIIFLFVVSASPCLSASAEYSFWTRNLSGITDTATGYYAYENAKMAVSGPYVHVVWLANAYGDVSGYRLFYRRSADGGQTFGSVQTLISSTSGGIFSETSMMLAADGNSVHLLYIQPGSSGSGDSLKYLRSTDSGQTFESPKTVYSTARYPSFNGVYLSAANGRVVIALSANDDNSPYPKDLACVYSNDGGATFSTTAIAHSTTIWRYTAVDMIQSSSNIYILYTVTDINDSYSTGKLYLVSSNDGGKTFNTPNVVNVASTDSKFYTTAVQGGSYSPNLAAAGNNVYVTWSNYEVSNDYYGTSTFTLRFRRSTDAGKTLGNPVSLTTTPASSSVLRVGQETVSAFGNNVYVATIYNGATMFWRSTDAGASFGATPLKISDGGWWPLIGIDPSVSDGSRVYVANYYLAKSTDAGASFNGVFTPTPNVFGSWNYPALIIDSSGVIHYVAQSAYPGDWHDIFYRRMPPAATPGANPKALNLVTDSSKRRDNMQIPASPDINLTSAMTVEFWIKLDFQGDGGNWPHFQVSVAKKRVSGAGTFELGYWNGFTGFYGRLVTEGAANQNYGDFIGANIIPADLTWYHIAMTYDAAGGANNWKYYVNGVLAGSATLTGNVIMDYMPLVLGPDTSSYYGTLHFSDFRIWNRARTAAEIASAKDGVLTGTESGLVAYYPFRDSTRDMTGRGNDGILMYQETFVSDPVPGFFTTAAPAITWRHQTDGKLYGMTTNGSGITGGSLLYQESNPAWTIVGQGDFDGDGLKDFVWQNSSTGQVYLMLMASPTAVKSGAIVYTESNTSWNIVATGDLNGDGKSDLIWWNKNTGQVYAMLLNGTAVAGGGLIYTEPNTNWKIVAAADFNGNGTVELLWWNSSTGQVALGQTNGTSTSSANLIWYEPDTNWRIAGAGDLDGDGKADIIWHNKSTGQVYGMQTNGSSVTNGAMMFTEPNTQWEIVSVGNYNSDNKADLLWWNQQTGQVYLMPMNGLAVAEGGTLLYTEPDTTWKIQGETAWRDNVYGRGVTTTTK
ncbi:MAG: FG-GAP-like repeat-containing protein [Desulfuromonadales bacterium]